MSLMGYTEKEVGNMLSAVEYASTSISDTDIVYWLDNAAEFLEGLLVEGRI